MIKKNLTINHHPSSIQRAFTLVELLVVMAIIGILVTLVVANFRTAQMRGRDAQRKSDLKNIANSLELFLSDYGQYPSDSGGVINGCPFDPASGSGSPCTWGVSEFTDGKSTYFKILPKDPSSGGSYLYRLVPGSNNQKFQLFASLENTKDPSCIGGDCSAPPVSYLCGGSNVCNFAITSPNTTPRE